MLLFLTICFVTPSLSNFCQKIISFQFFEMGLTSPPPIWTMSVNILFFFFDVTPNGVFMSKLAYLITLWVGVQQYLLGALQVQQLAAARAVCGMNCWRWSKAKLLARTGWLSVRQLVFYHTFL